jgi:hypothetical protein
MLSWSRHPFDGSATGPCLDPRPSRLKVRQPYNAVHLGFLVFRSGLQEISRTYSKVFSCGHGF